MEPVTPIPGFRFAPRLLALSMAAIIAAGCSGGGGDVNLNASQSTTINDNSTTNSGGGGSTNPCANYIDPETNTRVQGTFDGTNCVYGPEFVGEDNPLPVSLTIPFITGVHVFEDTLQVGKFVDGTNPNETVPQNGAGPTLTIRAGNKLAWIAHHRRRYLGCPDHADRLQRCNSGQCGQGRHAALGRRGHQR